MVFKDLAHKEFFEDCIDRARAANDPYHRALFYTLGLTKETRRNIQSLYDFNACEVRFKGLQEGWQTGTSLRVSRMAFNLFIGFAGDFRNGSVPSAEDYTPYNLFDTGLMAYFFEAVKLRYPESIMRMRTIGGANMNNKEIKIASHEEQIKFNELDWIADGIKVLLRFPQKANHQASAFVQNIMLESFSRRVFHAGHVNNKFPVP